MADSQTGIDCAQLLSNAARTGQSDDGRSPEAPWVTLILRSPASKARTLSHLRQALPENWKVLERQQKRRLLRAHH